MCMIIQYSIRVSTHQILTPNSVPFGSNSEGWGQIPKVKFCITWLSSQNRRYNTSAFRKLLLATQNRRYNTSTFRKILLWNTKSQVQYFNFSQALAMEQRRRSSANDAGKEFVRIWYLYVLSVFSQTQSPFSSRGGVR